MLHNIQICVSATIPWRIDLKFSAIDKSGNTYKNMPGVLILMAWDQVNFVTSPL